MCAHSWLHTFKITIKNGKFYLFIILNNLKYPNLKMIMCKFKTVPILRNCLWAKFVLHGHLGFYKIKACVWPFSWPVITRVIHHPDQHSVQCRGSHVTGRCGQCHHTFLSYKHFSQGMDTLATVSMLNILCILLNSALCIFKTLLKLLFFYLSSQLVIYNMRFLWTSLQFIYKDTDFFSVKNYLHIIIAKT